MNIDIKIFDHRRDAGMKAHQTTANIDARAHGFLDAEFIDEISFREGEDGQITGVYYRFRARPKASQTGTETRTARP